MAAVEHTVLTGETLYSLSRQHNVSVEAIKTANEGTVMKGLKVGQVVKIPVSNTNANEIEPTSTASGPQSTSAQTANESNAAVPEQSSGRIAITHTVEPKETLYSLSKRYGVTIDDIKSQNPDVEIRDLQIGQRLTITKN